MAAAKDNTASKTVKMYALPGKTIHLAITDGVDGDKNKGIPRKPPKMRVIQPKTVFECTPEDATGLIGQKAAVYAKDVKKVKTAQEKTDESSAAAAAGTNGLPDAE